MTRHVPIALLVLLAACDGGSEGANSSGDDSRPQPTVQQGVPEDLQDDGRNESVPLEPPPVPTASSAVPGAPAAAAARPQTFPAAFQGRWGLVAADCEPGRSDAKGLMEVGPATLRFYESRGTAQSMAQPRPGRIEATFAFSGEGMEWRRANALTLADDKTLVREERDPPASLRYTRCPEPR